MEIIVFSPIFSISTVTISQKLANFLISIDNILYKVKRKTYEPKKTSTNNRYKSIFLSEITDIALKKKHIIRYFILLNYGILTEPFSMEANVILYNLANNPKPNQTLKRYLLLAKTRTIAK